MPGLASSGRPLRDEVELLYVNISARGHLTTTFTPSMTSLLRACDIVTWSQRLEYSSHCTKIQLSGPPN